MESQIERINPVECRVRVQIPWAEVTVRLDKKLDELRRTTALPGYRRGKVPAKVIDRLFGRGVRDELARDLVQETFQTAVVSHKKVPLTSPVLEASTLERDEAFSYAARFEVAPEIIVEPADYEGVEVRRRPAAVTDEQVDAAIEAKRTELTELRPLAEGDSRVDPRAGDTWTADVAGSFGEREVSRDDVRIEIGSDQGEVIPGLAANMAGVKLDAVGTTVVLQFLPPQERLKDEFKGVEAKVKVALREVKEKIVPDLDDDFARDTGEAESLAELRTKLREQLLQSDGDDAEREARRRLVTSLLERKSFDPAPSMISREVQAQIQLFKRQLAGNGLTLAAIGSTEAQLAASLRVQAMFNVKAFLLLDAIGKSLGIDVSSEEVDKEVAEMAEVQGKNFQRLRATMEKNQELLLLRAQMREERILDHLMSKAVVTEAPDPSDAPQAEATAGEVGPAQAPSASDSA